MSNERTEQIMCDKNHLDNLDIALIAIGLIGSVCEQHIEAGMGNPVLYEALGATIHLAEHLDESVEDKDYILDLLKTTQIEMGENVLETQQQIETLNEMIATLKKNLTEKE